MKVGGTIYSCCDLHLETVPDSISLKAIDVANAIRTVDSLLGYMSPWAGSLLSLTWILYLYVSEIGHYPGLMCAKMV
jgi:hypothetical protein